MVTQRADSVSLGFEIGSLTDHTDRSTMKEVKCCLLRLKGIERKKLSESKFVCTIDSSVSTAVAANEWMSNANDRSVADSAFVNRNMFTWYVFYMILCADYCRR